MLSFLSSKKQLGLVVLIYFAGLSTLSCYAYSATKFMVVTAYNTIVQLLSISFLIFGLLIFGLVFVLTRGLKGQRDVNGAPHTWAEKIYVGHKILMKPSHDCSY